MSHRDAPLTPTGRLVGDYCGHRVLGDIARRYLMMGGPGRSLSCLLTAESVNPEGTGRRTQVEEGTLGLFWDFRLHQPA